MISRVNLNNTLTLKIRIYKYTILYAKNCTLYIKDKNSNDEIMIRKGSIVFFQRNIDILIKMIKHDESEPYEIHTLNNDTLSMLVKILEPVMTFPSEINSENISINRKIFTLDGTDYNKLMFKVVQKTKDNNTNIYGVACLLTQVKQTSEMYSSLCVSASRYFSDSVRRVIEGDLSKKWKLSNISDALNLSEVAVRKKLESEKTSFNKILLDIRMQKALRLILDENHHISKVSSSIGMSNTSYFIRVFSYYYGATPKQLYLYYKGCRN
ncbi:helix-turn-helix transcriptional regulator [Escherichia coli]|uniref:helix-turn-helix transcriptional regulator n=2 Tax=Escherichia coli TaxID=562 RepID=UPI0002A423EC|nr:helix-turn-helix transcriptional regulator [Escherichia coli]ELG03286.1 hypothetical protein A1S5_00024 [Escherichia coli KTE48]